MSITRSNTLIVRGLILLVWVAATVFTTSLVDLVGTDTTAYAWTQSIGLVTLGAAFALACAAATAGLLAFASLLALVGIGFQVFSAFMAAAPVVSSGGLEGPWNEMELVPGVRLAPLIGAAASLLSSIVLLLHAHRRLATDHPRVPFRIRLREARRALTLNPFILFFGPVFQKEVRVAGRHRSTYIARAVVPLILIGIVSIAYFGVTAELKHYAGAARLQELQRLAPILGMVIAWSQFALLVFIAPVLTSSAICDERRARTLPALMTTPMTSAQIIFGKLTSRLVQIAILSLIAAPLLLGIRIFGGLEARIVVAVTAVTLSAAVLAAALGLMYSIWHRRAATAAVFALLTLIALTLIPVSIMVAASLRTVGPPAHLSVLLGISAPVAMGGLTAAVMEPASGVDIDVVWPVNTAVNLGLAVVVGLFSTVALRRILRAEAAGALATERPRRGRARRTAISSPPPAAAPAESDASEPPPTSDIPLPTSDIEAVYATRHRTVSDAPVLWREVRQSTFGSRNKLIAVAAVVILGLAWMYWKMSLWDEGLHASVAIVGLLALCLHSALCTTGAIGGEREAKTWDVLLTTPLTPREIIGGKFLGGLRRQWFTIAIVGAHFAIAIATGWVHPVVALHLLLIGIGVCVLLCGTGILFSLLLRRATAAAVLNLALALALWVGLPIAYVFVDEFFRNFYGPTDDKIGHVIFAINPVGMAALATENITSVGSFRYRPLTYNFPEARDLTLGEFTSILCAVTLGGVLLGLGACLVAVKSFRRICGRVS